MDSNVVVKGTNFYVFDGYIKGSFFLGKEFSLDEVFFD